MNAFELKIYKPNGDLHWQMYFDTEKEMKNWIRDEESRPYWKKEFRLEIIDNREKIAAYEKEKQAFALQLVDKKDKAQKALKAFKKKKDKTLEDCIDAIEKIAEYINMD